MGTFLAIIIVVLVLTGVGWVVVFGGLAFLGVRFVKRKLLGSGLDDPRDERAIPGGHVAPPFPKRTYRGCTMEVKSSLKRLEKRLDMAHQQCLQALDTRLASELARARVAPPLEDAYAQMKGEVDAICAFCERNDLVGTLEKARRTSSAQDIYMDAYRRDLAKVQAALEKTEECLAAYERTVATLEVSTSDADLSSEFDASIEMLRDLREELPRYNLDDRV